jgi:universal stress protein A
MNLYQHILVAIDLAENSHAVALKAQQLAHANHAKLSLIYVAEVMLNADLNYETTLTLELDIEINRVLFNNAEKKLASYIENVKLTPHQQFLTQGDPRDEILRVAAENHVDLIVLGSHGRHGWALLFCVTSCKM